MGRCERTDCRFRMQEAVSARGEGPQCDYAESTGKTRLGQIYRALGVDQHSPLAAYYADPARCPFYERTTQMEPAGERPEAEGGSMEKKREVLTAKLRGFMEWQLEHYPENRRRLKEEQKYLTELRAVDWSTAGVDSAPGRPAENAAERLESDKYIRELKRSTEAVEKVLEKLSEEDRTLIELVYWQKSLHVEGAANRLHISRRTAYRHIEGVLTAIAGEMGYIKTASA